MAPTEADLLRLTLTVHEAATDHTLWPRFLESYARVIDADVTLIQTHHFASRQSSLLADHGVSSPLRASYHAEYSRLNVWREHGRDLYTPGRVVVDQELYPRSLLTRSEFYNDYLRYLGATRGLTGTISRRDNEAVVLTTMRRESGREWRQRDRQIVTLLFQHITRAFATAERLQLGQASEAVLNSLPFGLALLNREGHIVFSNRAAEDILRAADGLVVRQGALRAVDGQADASIERAVQLALKAPGSLEVPSPAVVPRPSMRRSYIVTVSPVCGTPRLANGFSPIAGVVFIADGERRRPTPVAVLRQLYHLTRREADLAVGLADGHPLDQAADRLGMSYETARTHLRRILGKTRMSRQAELILLLERLSHQAITIP